MMGISKVARKITALVVEDDNTTRRVHEAQLRKFGLETKTVENGKEAVDLFLAGNSFDLVLMGLEMPVMDGHRVPVQATCALRGMGVTCMIVGALISDKQEVKDEFLSAGLDFCWEKPLCIPDYVVFLDELANKLQ